MNRRLLGWICGVSVLADPDELTPQCQVIEDQCPGMTQDSEDGPGGGPEFAR